MLSNTPVIARSAATSQSHESDTNDEIATSSLRTPRNDSNIITLRISCSTGTYIRTLAHDIGQAFGTGAYCEELRRTKIGEYSVEDAIGPKEIEVKVLPPLLFQIP
jgi:tRNA pseudouridine(55) synthase